MNIKKSIVIKEFYDDEIYRKEFKSLKEALIFVKKERKNFDDYEVGAIKFRIVEKIRDA